MCQPILFLCEAGIFVYLCVMATKKTQENTSKYWWLKHLVLAVLAAFVTVLILFWMLKGITRHGKTLEVPDLTNMTLSEARKVAKQNHIRIKITDSVYIPQLHAGQVLKQTPAAGSRVKKNRNILITINSLVPMMVKAPDVVGYSLRQAESNLHAANLQIGRLNYVPDIATNSVMGQSIKGKPLVPGTEIPAQSEIDLTLGLSGSDCWTRVPNLITLPYHRVKSELTYNSLNLDKILFDGTVNTYADTLNSIVYKQEPDPTIGNSVRMGTGVILYLTLNKDLAELNKKNVKPKDQVRDTTVALPKDTELEEVKPETEGTADDSQPGEVYDDEPEI